MTGSLDEKMYQRQVRKQGLSGAVVDARDSERVHFSTKELKVGSFINLMQKKILFSVQENDYVNIYDMFKHQKYCSLICNFVYSPYFSFIFCSHAVSFIMIGGQVTNLSIIH